MCLFIHPSIHLSVHLSVHLSICSFTMYLSMYSFIHLSNYPSMHLFIHLSIYPSIYPITHGIHIYIQPFIHLPTMYIFNHLSIYPPCIYSSIYPFTHHVSAVFRILWEGGKYVCLGMKGGGGKPPSLCVSTCKARGVRERILRIVEAQSSCIHRLIVTLYTVGVRTVIFADCTVYC